MSKRDEKIKYFMDNPMVIVKPKKGDAFTHEFQGQVTGIHGNSIAVRDGDDNWQCVDLEQLTPIDPLDDYPQ